MNKNAFLLTALSLTTAGCALLRTPLTRPEKHPVSLNSLLREMTNQESITYYPSTIYKTRSYSSYDRNSVAPDKPGWFANADASQFIRVETNAARRELVMLDATGPGAITRFWVTIANSDGGTLRFYIDGKLAVEGRVLDILSGGALCGAPLSSSVSPLTQLLHRGHNLYLPIPYAKGCKVTYESPNVWAAKKAESFYYNIETRAYPAGTVVESFSKEALAREAATIAEVNRRLSAAERGLPDKPIAQLSFDGELAAGASVSRTFDGPAAIRSLSLAVNGGKDIQAMRSTVLEISFDGERTVWAPVGDFFGTGYKLSPYKAWYSQAEKDGLLRCAWLMPFAKTCTLTVKNLGDKAVTLTNAKIATAPYAWDAARSMHFSAEWKNLPNVRTQNHCDINYATLTGKGLVVGTGVTVFNHINQWWGEGDEKIYVDGEAFPSYIGTGTEDYYGYAWCEPAPFDHPFIAQPDGSGNLAPGYSVNLRHRILDAIPFSSKLKLDFELWDWADTRIDFATMAYCYLLPGSTSDGSEQIAEAKRTVSLEQPKLEGDTITLEGEYGGHLQSVCKDELGNLYWSHTVRLIKTDKHGHILVSVPVPSHHGGMCYLNGKIYVAVCMLTGNKGTKKDRVKVSVYDCDTLNKVEDHIFDKNDRAGSIAFLNNTFVIGCLRGEGLSPSQVRLHRYTRDFKYIDTQVIETGETIPLGTENIVAHDNSLYLSMYTQLLLRLSPELKEIAKYRQDAAFGSIFEGDSFWYGTTRQDKQKKTWHSGMRRMLIRDFKPAVQNPAPAKK